MEYGIWNGIIYPSILIPIPIRIPIPIPFAFDNTVTQTHSDDDSSGCLSLTVTVIVIVTNGIWNMEYGMVSYTHPYSYPSPYAYPYLYHSRSITQSHKHIPMMIPQAACHLLSLSLLLSRMEYGIWNMEWYHIPIHTHTHPHTHTHTYTIRVR